MDKGQLLQAGLGPADVGVSRRVRPGENFHAHPAEPVSLSRDATPGRIEGDIGIADPLRPSEEYTLGKPFPWPGIQLSFVFSPQQWKWGPPLGFIRKVFSKPGIHIPPGYLARDQQRVNIETPPAHAYGSLFATYSGGS